MAVLITGGAGYIGSATVRAARQRGEQVVVYDNLSAGHRAAVPADVPLVVGDLADTEKLAQTIGEHEVREVIHFAAFTSVPESVAKPEAYFQNNSLNTLGLLNVMRDKGVRRFIFSSTAATYGEPVEVPLLETHPSKPTNPYGHSKRFTEIMLESFDVAHGTKYVSLRYFNASGGAPDCGEDHTPETHLIPLILQVALGQREKIFVFGNDYATEDGTCVRDYIHVADLASAHLLALDHLRGGGSSEIVNLGNGTGYSVREVIDTCRAVTGHPIPEEFKPRRAGDPSALIASSEKARTVLGWTPRYPELRAIVESAWEWHKGHPEGYGD